MSRALAHPYGPPIAPARATPRQASQGWRVYLVLATLLAPVCVPAGPGQTAALDFLNVSAIGLFALLALAPRRRLRVPLLLPMVIVAAGSLLAALNAPSMGLVTLAVAQDIYLFAWFLVVVNVVRGESDLALVRRAWMWTAALVAAIALGQLLMRYGTLATLLGSRGLRPSSTLYNPNMLADYLVISLFLTASLAGQVGLLVRLPLMGIMALGLLATKSNGGMAALASGSLVWVTVRALTSGVRLRTLAAGALLLAGLAGFGAWLNHEWGLGDAELAAFREHTFAGRLEHSSESRLRIWDQLERTYQRSPLGIGPGNSGALTLGISERERPDSYRSKEAHSDYLAYAIERGPLGLLGLLLMTGALYVQVWRTWRGRSRRSHRVEATSRWVSALAAALTASAVHSAVIEKLHFRHFWLLAALVASSSLVAARRESRRRALAFREQAAAVLPPAPSVARTRRLARGVTA